MPITAYGVAYIRVRCKVGCAIMQT